MRERGILNSVINACACLCDLYFTLFCFRKTRIRVNWVNVRSLQEKKKSSVFGSSSDKKIAGNVEKKKKVKAEFEVAAAAVKESLEALRPTPTPLEGEEGGDGAASSASVGEGSSGDGAVMRRLRVHTLEAQLADHERLSKNFAATLYGVFHVCATSNCFRGAGW